MRLIVVGLITVVAIPAPGRATSPAEELLSDRFVFDLGGFLVTSKVSGSLRGSANAGDEIVDFAEQFGTDADQTRWRADMLWRITPRQHLRLSYFDNDVTGTRTINRDFTWGDYTFLAGGPVTAETKFRVYELTYEFAFLRRNNYEIAVSAGVHIDDLTLKLSGNASLTLDTGLGPVQLPPAFTTQSNSVTEPLPVLGFRADWAVSPRVYLEAAAEVFAISYQGIDGNWSDLRAGATWMFSNHFGVGLGYNRFATHVDVSKLSFSGRLNLGYQGGLIYLKAGF